jgi:ribosomal protein S18 acetylase RimI-like enzyme
MPLVTESVIRLARLDDAESLHRHCYPEASLEDVRDYLAWCLRQSERGWIVRWVAEIEGQAVGNVQLTVWKPVGEVGSLVVGRAFRRRGLARGLMVNLIVRAKRLELSALELEVSGSQPAILSFYHRLGFVGAPEAKKRLSHSASVEPAVLLRKLL